MNWIETPYGDIPHKFSTMARTKNTPARRTPSAKYTFGRRIPTSTTARRALNFAGGSPYQMIGRSTPRRKTTAAKIGFPTGSATGYKAVTVNKWESVVASSLSKTIVTDNVTAIARQTVGNEINLRERDMINCLGFTLRVCLNNTQDTTAAVVRMALVSPLDKNEINSVEFFRGYDDRRTVDFSNTLDSSVLNYSPINRDNYVVLWEKKLILGNDINSTATSQVNCDRNRPNYQSFTTYIPLNRQLRYDGPSAAQCSENIFLLMWYDTPQGEGVTPPSTFVNYRRYVITHWKNPGQFQYASL